MTPRGRLTGEDAAAFAELGVHRLVPMPRPADTLADIEALIAAAVAIKER